MFYAQIDENNICVGISNLSGQVDNPNLIEMNCYDSNFINKVYNSSTKTWEVNTNPKAHTLTYEEVRQEYLTKIKEAQILGETEEVARLQAEWQQKKAEFETTT